MQYMFLKSNPRENNLKQNISSIVINTSCRGRKGEGGGGGKERELELENFILQGL